MDGPVVVVGGGIIGTAAALELQTAGRDTILVERDIQPQGASAFSFATISAFDEPQRDVYLLRTQGMVTWREWAKSFGSGLGAAFPGELRWAQSPEGAERLISLMERAVSRGYPVRSISGADIPSVEPGSRSGKVRAATLAANDGYVDPLAAIEVLKGAFADRGGALVVGRASLMIEGRGVTVRVGDDRIPAGAVVIAAGAETATLLERFEIEVPMDPSPGLLAVTTPVEPFLGMTVYVYPDDGPAVHLRQREDGRVLIGERSQHEVARNPTLEHARKLLLQAKSFFPALEGADVDHFTVEWRPMPRDGMPIVGPIPGLPSIYVATGHGGVTIAPALGNFIAREVAHGEEVDRLAMFRPSRFAAHKFDAYRHIEEAFDGSSEVFLG